MTLRVCLDCMATIPTGRSRCTRCERILDKARGTRQERGYDAAHDRLRADYQRRMDAGERFTCWRCAEQGKPHDVNPAHWHLGHDDQDRSVHRGPECPAGNLATAARRISPDA